MPPSSTPLLEVKVLDFFASLKRDGATPQRVLVACSGGVDSLALLLALSRLRSPLGIALVVGTLDHGLRAESAAECQHVMAVAASLEVPAESRALALGKATPSEARDARYTALLAIAASHRCDAIAVGHNANDQLETLIDHLLRGSGLRGLAGMPATRLLDDGVRLIRPLLAVSRASIDAYVGAAALAPVDDPSNRDPRYRRTRLRHEVIAPLLAERPDLPTEAVALCARLAEDEAALVWASEQIDPHDRRALSAAPAGLRVRAIERLTGRLSAKQHLAVARLLTSGNGTARLALPSGQWLWREYDRLRVGDGEEPRPRAPRPNVSLRLAAQPATRHATWRRWRAGDRIRLRGHHRLLSDLFIDAKLPRVWRAGVDVLVSTEGDVLAFALPPDAPSVLPPLVERDSD